MWHRPALELASETSLVRGGREFGVSLAPDRPDGLLLDCCSLSISSIV